MNPDGYKEALQKVLNARAIMDQFSVAEDCVIDMHYSSDDKIKFIRKICKTLKLSSDDLRFGVKITR